MHPIVGLDSVVVIPTCYRLGSLGDHILVEARFSTPVWTAPGAHPASCTASTLLFLGVKQLGCDINPLNTELNSICHLLVLLGAHLILHISRIRVNHPPPSSAEVKERVELFLYSPSVPLWHVTGWTLPFNPLKPELNPICYLLALLGAHHFLHVSRIRVKLLTLRWLMSYIYGAPILDVSRSHTTTQHSR